MKRVYDYVFVTHLPAFYKVNLYQEIAKQCRIFVIFISNSSTIRNADFTPVHYDFDYCILNNTAFEKRFVLMSLLRIWLQCRKITFRKMIVGGWDLLEFWLLIFLNNKSQNMLALESSAYESKVGGIRGFLKKLFLSRISLVFPSGHPHACLLEKLQFSGQHKITLGVGLFNYQSRTISNRAFAGQFLFVGRLAPEKNLERLVQVFKDLPHFSLTLIGQGPLYSKLQAICAPNVTLLGYIANSVLSSYYEQHQIFILPSISEPWGLVVEEALYYGLPVVSSTGVGCAKDLVIKWQAGVVFNPLSSQDLKNAIQWAAENYQSLANNVSQINFKVRDLYQVQQYLEALA